MTDIHKIKEEELVLTINDQLFFEMILPCISYASFKKKESRLEEELMSNIKQYEDNLCESNVHWLEQKRQELTALRNKRVEGMIVRSQAKWLYEGEKTQNISVNLRKETLYKKPCVLFKKKMVKLFMIAVL